MDERLLIELFQNIIVWKSGGQRAPHKPLLCLYALGSCFRSEKRLIPYSEIDKE
jgi:putative restriction endonuclease